MLGLQENGMSNGEVLAAVNNNRKSRTPKTFPQFFGYYKVLLHTFYFQRLS
jgi:hypothetical protein